MKTISKKQFEEAARRVLNGGKSKLVYTQEVKPYYWTKSGSYFNLRCRESDEAMRFSKKT